MAWEWVKINLGKGQAAVAVLLVAILPWLSGGRDPAGLITIYGATALGFFLVWRLNYKVPAKPTLALPATCLLIWATTSTIWSVNRYQTVIWVIILALLYGLFNLAYHIGSKRHLIEAWLGGFLALASFASLYGFVLYLGGSYDRLTSIFAMAGPMAGWLLPAIIIAGWRFMQRGGWFYGLVVTINLTALTLTGSHDGIITLALVSFISLSFAKQKINHWIRIVFVLIASLVLAIGLNLGRAKLPHHSLLLPGSASAQAVLTDSASLGDRLRDMRSVLAIWSGHPIIGTGAGSFATMHPQYQYGVTSAAVSADNVYAQSASELGLVGAGLVVWLVIELLAGIWRGARRDPELPALALGLVALLLHFAVDLDATFPVILALGAILAGLVYRPKERRGKPARFGLLATAALVFLVTLPVVSDYHSRTLAAYGQIEQTNGRLAASIQDYEQAHLQLTYDPVTLNAEGTALLTLASQGQDTALNLAKARARAEAGIRLDGQDGQQYWLLGRVEEASSQPAAAETAYRRALTLDPYNHPVYYTDLAGLYLKEEKFTAALNLANQVTSLYPPGVLTSQLAANPELPAQLSTAYSTKAAALVQLGRLDEAHQATARALELNAANVVAQQLEASTGQ